MHSVCTFETTGSGLLKKWRTLFAARTQGALRGFQLRPTLLSHPKNQTSQLLTTPVTPLQHARSASISDF